MARLLGAWLIFSQSEQTAAPGYLAAMNRLSAPQPQPSSRMRCPLLSCALSLASSAAAMCAVRLNPQQMGGSAGTQAACGMARAAPHRHGIPQTRHSTPTRPDVAPSRVEDVRPQTAGPQGLLLPLTGWASDRLAPCKGRAQRILRICSSSGGIQRLIAACRCVRAGPGKTARTPR